MTIISKKIEQFIKVICLAMCSLFVGACGGSGTGSGGSNLYSSFVTNGGGPELFIQESDPRHAFEIADFLSGNARGTEAWLIEGTYCRGEVFEGTLSETFEASFCIENSAGLERPGQPSCYTGGIISPTEANFNGETYRVTDQSPGC